MTIFSRKPLWSSEVDPALYIRDRLAQMRAEVRWYRGILVGLFVLLGVFGFLLWRTSTGEHLIVQNHVFDLDGKILWQGRAGELSLNEVQLFARLDELIEWLRRRSDDPIIDEKYWALAQKMAIGEASTMIEGYLIQVRQQQAENPGNRERVQVTITGHTRESHQEYRVTWQEVWSPTFGRGKKLLKMQATLKVDVRAQRDKWGRLQLTAADYAKSPTGVFVTWLDWSPILQADGQIWGKSDAAGLGVGR